VHRRLSLEPNLNTDVLVPLRVIREICHCQSTSRLSGQTSRVGSSILLVEISAWEPTRLRGANAAFLISFQTMRGENNTG